MSSFVRRACTRRIQAAGLLFILLVAMAGCDPAYRYVFYPPQRIEYALAPDPALLRSLNDTSYSISKDSLAIVFDRKTFKVEVRYLSDYQLNNFDLPDDSKDGFFSANPFTYANWVDLDLGYTPNRFSVFKISIFNYTMSKINFDPERSFLVSDRGDMFPGYGREEKSSKNESLESYYRKRKGSSGVDDDIFERRMGIVRTTVLYLGRPIYQGDSREGIVVYDPLNESVQRVKLVLNNFIVGYDENNEPSEYLNLQFFFQRKPLVKEKLGPLRRMTDSLATANTSLPPNVDFYRLRYRTESSEGGVPDNDWNSRPTALTNLARFAGDSLKIKISEKSAPPDSPELLNARIVFLLAGPTKPVMTEVEIAALANVIRRGGFLIIDNAAFPSSYQYFSSMEQLLVSISGKLDRDVRVMSLPNENELFRAWHRFPTIPEGMDDRENVPEKRNFLQGLFWRNRLVAVLSSKGYCMIWEKGDQRSLDQFLFGTNMVLYALRTVRTQ